MCSFLPLPNDLDELKAAVTCYMAASDADACDPVVTDASSNTKAGVKALYGESIGSWDVSLVQSFYGLFSKDASVGGTGYLTRGEFNLNISAWNT